MANPTLPLHPQWHMRADPPAGGWSSIIGIVVAIVGNILISFALNTQRYAHIKLNREREEREQESKARSDKGRKREVTRGYGTAQEDGTGQTRERRGTLEGGSRRESLTFKRGESEALLEDGERRDSVYTVGSGREEKGEVKDKSYLSSGWWWLGISLMVVGECGNFLAYGFAPASIVSPLGVVALISNCLIAPWMLHEKFRKKDALGVVIAVAGCVVVVLSASGNNPKLTADQIWALISTWEFETYFGITAFLTVVLIVASNKYGDKSILIDLGLVGLFGGYTALSTKGVASLLSNTIWRVVTFPVTYLLLFVLIGTAIAQIKYVNRALQRFDSTQVIPIQFVMFTLSVIIGSAILYRDFERKSAEDAVKFFAGCALTFLGVWCITSGRGKDSQDEEEGSSDEEEGIHLYTDDAEPAYGRSTRSARPHTPQRIKSSMSAGPILKIDTSSDNAEPLEVPEDLFPGALVSAHAPAANAAVHHSPARMRGPSDSPERSRKPRMHATTSEPVLPTSAMSERSVNLLRSPDASSPLLRSTTQERPRTPENAPFPEPSSATTPRFGSIGRHSIADMLPHPGPLTNPLSGSLSAIVAESLRRGVDHIPGTSLRRRSLRSKRSRRLDEALTFTQLAQPGGLEERSRSPSKLPSGAESDLGMSTDADQSDTETEGSKAKFGSLLQKKKSRNEEEMP
ncbi:magnesium transporter NIPA-domain-containing protein [Elsinoe ampelina]|uniref:Magnesium transporter NIPA-domain-containing protein n=1 Tax=Elsinoe ampelina TaxID=302913 RepID=A0A6A6GLI4_9PEZI|nr:magnesium transporter NIPA-domain-containing protein [Elsinoe ampelina]